jgi:Sulfatase
LSISDRFRPEKGHNHKTKNSLASAKTAHKKPNMVFILVDNIGWGDFSVYGGTTATPRIDGLANSGIRCGKPGDEMQWTPQLRHAGRRLIGDTLGLVDASLWSSSRRAAGVW